MAHECFFVGLIASNCSRSGYSNAFYFKGKKFRKFINCVFASVGLVLMSSQTHAASLQVSDVIESYQQCTYLDDGNQIRINVVMSFKDAKGRLGVPASVFRSRGVMIYIYDDTGRPIYYVLSPASVLLDGAVSIAATGGTSERYNVFYRTDTGANWTKSTAFTATASLRIPKSIMSSWAAISVRAANVTNAGDVAEITGAVYIYSDECNYVTDPTAPPPPDININMTVNAPDWHLGDLKQGESEITLGRTDQQLCFSYSSQDVFAKTFIINAGNANGVVNNRYKLQHVSDASQFVPYRLTLDHGRGTPVQLPNNNTSLTFLGGGELVLYPPSLRKWKKL